MSPEPLTREQVGELATAAAFLAHHLGQFAHDTTGAESGDYARRAALLQVLAGNLVGSGLVLLSGGVSHA